MSACESHIGIWKLCILPLSIVEAASFLSLLLSILTAVSCYFQLFFSLGSTLLTDLHVSFPI